MTSPRHPARLFAAALIAFFALVCGQARAQLAPGEKPPVSARFELMRTGSGGLAAVLWFTPDQGWHTYGNVNGEAGAPTTATVTLGPDKPAPRIVYPPGTPTKDVFEPDKPVFIHDGPTPILAYLPPDTAAPIHLEGSVRMVLCSDVSCRLETVTAALDLGSIDASALPKLEDAPWFSLFSNEKSGAAGGTDRADRTGVTGAAGPAPAKPELDYSRLTPRFAADSLEVSDLGKAAVLAFLAGLILNVMPCVLPVASLKFSGILAASAEDPLRRFRDLRQYNVFFALGILTYFLILSAILGMANMAWGQLFQSVPVILGMAAAVFALSLSLFGLYNLPVIDLKRAPKKSGHTNTKAAAFATGILATLLATPCSGPFLGGVLAWTLIQPVWIVSTVFACIGLGMSGPYLLFALRPDLIHFFPKPGPWLEYLEKTVGFVLLGTSLYLLSVLPGKFVFPALFAFLAIAFAAWMWGSWTGLSQKPGKRRLIRALAALLAVAAVWLAFSAETPSQTGWEEFGADRFAIAYGKENILVDFTADWCPNCKLLEKTVLTETNLAAWKSKYKLRLLRADITGDNPEAMALLKALKSQAIPTAALFAKGDTASAPLVLRDLFTASRLEEAMAATFR